MRQNSHDVVDIETAFAGRKSLRVDDRSETRELASQRADQLGVRAVARFDRDDVATNPLPEEREIADDIEDFMPHEFVGEAQRFLTQNRIAADHDRILEAAALDQ